VLNLWPFQKLALTFLMTPFKELNYKPHKVLALDMGLGKTPIVCVAIRELKLKSALIFCPKSIKATWQERLVEWGAFNLSDIFICHTMKDKIPADKKCVILNYELGRSRNKVKNEDRKIVNPLFKQLYARQWEALVCDEAHRLKSTSSGASFTILHRNGYPLAGRCLHKWMLSGSFIPNRPMEMYPVFKALASELIAPYDKKDLFAYQFCAGFIDGFGTINSRGASNIDDLVERVRPLVMWMRMEDVYSEMPETVEDEIVLEVGDLQVTEKNAPHATAYKAVGIAKVQFVADYLKDRLTYNKEKIVVFSYHRDVVEYLQKNVGFKAQKLYGGMSDKERSDAMNVFVNDPDSLVFVIQIRAGGEGVDGLQRVCHNIVFAENEYGTGMRNQAIGRLRRFGQKSTIRVTSFRAGRTLDVKVIKAEKAKRKVIDQFKSSSNMEIQIMSEGLLERAVTAIESIATSLADLSSKAFFEIAAAGVNVSIPGKESVPAEKTQASGSVSTPAPSAAESDKKPAAKKTPAGTGAAQKKDVKAAEKDSSSDTKVAESTLTIDQVKKAAVTAMKAMQAKGLSGAEAQEAVRAVNESLGSADRMIDGLPADQYEAAVAAYAAAVEEASTDLASGV
jgi:SWI/SNF-related matrix-associated actin-dependent regulator 1 of chromatin subfamily A